MVFLFRYIDFYPNKPDPLGQNCALRALILKRSFNQLQGESSMGFNKLKRAFFVLGVIFMTGINGCSLGYEGPVSDHFDGSRFYGRVDHHGFTDMVKWMWEMEVVDWPVWVEDENQPLPVAQVDEGELRVTHINHATILIQMDHLNILTDPIWSYRAGPFSWLGVKRVRAPGIEMDALPRIDYILISHDHYDHLDIPTLKQITARYQPIVLVGLGLRNYLVSKGIDNVVEMDWWQKHKTDREKFSIYFVPAQHNSGRWPLMGNKTLWGGYIIDSPGGSVYFAGDTGFGDFVFTIGQRFERIRLAILPIGSYEKRWFMKAEHMNPEDAVRTHLILRASQSIGMHFGTFNEHPEQPIDAHEKDLEIAVREQGLFKEQFWILKFGESRNVAEYR